ncbi:MAG TPA: PD-(D/E)XK nuclease family protein [Candidatus Tumulicola sp.]
MDPRYVRAFVDDAVAWCDTQDRSRFLSLLRSPLSQVPHDTAAAYAKLAERSDDPFEAIERSQLGVDAAERESAAAFCARLRQLRGTTTPDHPKEQIADFVYEIFSLPYDEPVDVESRSNGASFDLCVAGTPETPRGVVPRKRHFSASSLNAYVECSRKWFYRYSCAAIEDPGSSAAAYGTSFHLALEEFHGEFPRPAASQEAQMRERIAQSIRWAFERNRSGFETAVEFELQVRRAARTAQRYVDWLLLQERVAPFEVIGREVPANLDLGGHEFVGFIDRLDRDARSGGVGVVDYKTGSIALSAAEYREKVRTMHDFQLPFYYWARTEAGDRVTRLALLPLKDATLDVRPIVLEVVPGDPPEDRTKSARGTIGTIELERARTKMIDLSQRLSGDGIQRFDETADPSACTFCAYVTACAHRPPPEPARFGQ